MEGVRASVPLAVAIVVVLLVANTGCISIYTVRDALVLKKSTKPLVYVHTKALLRTWQANKLLTPDLLDESLNIMVKDGTKSLELTYNVSLVSGIIGRALNITLPTTPYVNLKLSTPSGDVIWEQNYTSTKEGKLPFLGPSAGIWVLRMEAKGYGGTVPGTKIEAHDAFQVEVWLFEPK
jgi:hypothetical protein